MNHYSWFAVRCCCQPAKVFGFLRLQVSSGNGSEIEDRFGRRHKVEIKDITRVQPVSVDYLLVTKQPSAGSEREAERAIYSDDRPIEFWRNIIGFIETPDVNA